MKTIGIELRIRVHKLQDYHYGLVESVGLKIEKVFTRPDHQTLLIPLNAKLDAHVVMPLCGELGKSSELLKKKGLKERLALELLIVVGSDLGRQDVEIDESITKFCCDFAAKLRVYWYEK